MGEEKLIQVSFQIPPSALDSISRLAQQLRLLTQAVGAQSAPTGRTAESEYVESGFFDPERFYELQRDMRDPQAVRRTIRDIADAPAASPELSPVRDAEAVSAESSQTGDAVAVSARVQEEPHNARGAGDEFSRQPAGFDRAAAPDGGPQYILPEERGDPLPPVREPQAEAEDLTLFTAPGEVTGGIETPAGAGIVVQAQPEVPQSWWGTAEELVIPDPAPLTAEAVSMALERDGRRYDNGFPLY